MGDRWLGPDDVVTFVHSPQKDAAEVNRPDAVVHLLEADGVLLQGVGNEEQPLLKPERPGVRDALHDEMSGILDRRQGAGVEPRRRPIPRRRRGALEELVRPLVVVLGAEAIERALLRRELITREDPGTAALIRRAGSSSVVRDRRFAFAS